MDGTDVSIIRQMDKEDVVHICNGILLSHKKKTNATIYNLMDENMLSAITQTERNASNDFTLQWSISTNKKLKEQHRSSLAKPKNGLTVTKQKVTAEDGWEGRDKRENWALQVAHIMCAGRRAQARQ